MRTLKLLLVLAGCASATSGTTPDANTEKGCMSDTDCGSSQICRAGLCTTHGGGMMDAGMPDSGSMPPHIIVMPSELDFGSPLLGTEVLQTVTVGNLGSPLTISRITVESDGGEFSATPNGEVGIVLAVAGLTTVSVWTVPRILDTVSQFPVC